MLGGHGGGAQEAAETKSALPPTKRTPEAARRMLAVLESIGGHAATIGGPVTATAFLTNENFPTEHAIASRRLAFRHGLPASTAAAVAALAFSSRRL